MPYVKLCLLKDICKKVLVDLCVKETVTSNAFFCLFFVHFCLCLRVLFLFKSEFLHDSF